VFEVPPESDGGAAGTAQAVSAELTANYQRGAPSLTLGARSAVSKRTEESWDRSRW
jgi:hypothetical protein